MPESDPLARLEQAVRRLRKDVDRIERQLDAASKSASAHSKAISFIVARLGELGALVRGLTGAAPDPPSA